VRNVERIISVRRFHQIRMEDLQKLRVSLKKVRPFVLCQDHNPDALRIDSPDLRQRVIKPEQQLELFESMATARTGEI
jgi:predicted DNA-binding helix-hairpin-helix protein